jgi:hypothetical protein
MTVRIELSPVRAERLARGFSRYRKQNVINYGEERFLTFDTYIRPIYTRTGDEKVMLISKGYEYRPDLVAYDVYKMPEAWWWIMEFNGMKDIMEFKAGVTIMLPDTMTID